MAHHLPVPNNAAMYSGIRWPRSQLFLVRVYANTKQFKLPTDWLLQGKLVLWSDVLRLIALLVNEQGRLYKIGTDAPVDPADEWTNDVTEDRQEYEYRPGQFALISSEFNKQS